MHYINSKGGDKRLYRIPRIECIQFKCEAGFAVSNDNLTEENWGWDE